MTNLMCIALAVYMEARSESLVGQISVAKVVQNRMARESLISHVYNPVTCEEVISKKHQFPWFVKLKKHMKEVVTNKDFANALILAAALDENDTIDDPTKGAQYFHEKRVKPSWAKKKVLTLSEGNHRFYE